MMRVLVTGDQSALERDIVTGLRRAGYETHVAGPDELDLLDAEACRAAVAALRPNVLIHCPAPGRESTETTVRAAAHAAEAARAVDAYSIYVSCPEVFAGDAQQPYIESDTAAPVTAIGAVKLEAESSVARLNPRHAIVRTAWLFGDGDGPVDAILAEAAVSDRIVADASITSSPTYTRDVAEGIISLVRQPAYGIFHLAGSGSCTLLHLARVVLRLVGSKATAVVADESATPRNLALASRRREVAPLPHWKIALRTYLETRQALTATGGER